MNEPEEHLCTLVAGIHQGPLWFGFNTFLCESTSKKINSPELMYKVKLCRQ